LCIYVCNVYRYAVNKVLNHLSLLMVIGNIQLYITTVSWSHCDEKTPYM